MALLASFLIVLFSNGGCDAGDDESPRPLPAPVLTSSPEPEAPTDPLPSPEPEAPTDPLPSPEPEAPVDPPEPEEAPIQTCRMPGTTPSERAGCETDSECVLSRIDYTNCSESRCGFARHPYNCEFARRLVAFCSERSCENSAPGFVPDCPRGGQRAPMAGFCVDGSCVERVAQIRRPSRLLDVTGAVDEQTVRRLLRRQLRTVESCFAAEGEGDTEEPGMVVQIVVSPSGTVRSATLVNSATNDGSIRECVLRTLRAVAFPASTDGEPVELRYFVTRGRRPSCDGVR